MPERTLLAPQDEAAFQQWVQQNQLGDVDHPDAHYDMRGYWKGVAAKGADQSEINAGDGLRHFPDTYKQHGHPTFSVESQYSAGPYDGGRWVNNDAFVPPGADLMINSRGQSRIDPQQNLRAALIAKLKGER